MADYQPFRLGLKAAKICVATPWLGVLYLKPEGLTQPSLLPISLSTASSAARSENVLLEGEGQKEGGLTQAGEFGCPV